jgi:hypothetical protein
MALKLSPEEFPATDCKFVQARPRAKGRFNVDGRATWILTVRHSKRKARFGLDRPQVQR